MTNLKQKTSSQTPSIESNNSQVKRQAWYSTVVPDFVVNIFAGLILTAILLVVKTFSAVVITICVLVVIVLVGSTLNLARKNKKLQQEVSLLQENLTSCENLYDSQLQSIGITEISNTLGESRWSPDSVMGRANRAVRFIGVFGHKWVMDAQRRETFRAMLTRIQLNGGKVQFMLLDPNCSAAIQLANFRKQEPNTYKNFHSIEFFKELAAQFDCFEIRLFQNFPFIRLIFVDGQCAISRFKINSGAEETLNAPQLAFSPDLPGSSWTLYQPFVQLYDYLWLKAKNPFLIFTETPSESLTKEINQLNSSKVKEPPNL
jgi:hypothetical protein